jgi:hypothetical protein
LCLKNFTNSGSLLIVNFGIVCWYGNCSGVYCLMNIWENDTSTLNSEDWPETSFFDGWFYDFKSIVYRSVDDYLNY